METKEVNVEIKGLSPLLMNKFHIEALEPKIKKGSSENIYGSPKEQADKTAYWSSSKHELCIPSEVLTASLVNASKNFKFGKKSAVNTIVTSIWLSPNEIMLGTSKYEIDSRGVVIAQGMKRNRVVRHRARLDNWKAKFMLNYDAQTISNPELIKQILEYAGQKVGIMDFRPANRGTFGRFEITKFDVNGK